MRSVESEVVVNLVDLFLGELVEVSIGVLNNGKSIDSLWGDLDDTVSTLAVLVTVGTWVGITAVLEAFGVTSEIGSNLLH